MENTLTERELREKYEYRSMHEERKNVCVFLKKNFKCNGTCLRGLVFNALPVLTWLPKYPFRRYAIGDFISGLTVSVVRIPQGLAYGLLAGLCPINGLYTGFFSPIVYLIFGSSKHISVGVVAITSLMLAAVLEKGSIDTEKYFITHEWPTMLPDTDISSSESFSTFVDQSTLTSYTGKVSAPILCTEEQNLAIIGSLTVLIGVIMVILGCCRLGIVSMFLSNPVVSGFTSGVVIHAVTAQLKYITGIPLQRRSGPFSIILTYVDVFSMMDEMNYATMIVSGICLGILVPIKYVNRTYKERLRNIPIPIEFLLIIFATFLSRIIRLNEKYNVQIVGYVPSGMPTPVLPMLSLWPDLIADAMSIAVVIFAMSISLGKIYSQKHGYQIDPNQELIALGLCQITSGFFRGHAGGTSLSRTSVQESSGGKSQLVGLVSSCILLLVLLVIGPLFQSLPIACLACIILSNLHGLLMQFQSFPRLWKIDKYDFSVWTSTFTAVFFIGIDLGLGIGVFVFLVTGVLRSRRISITDLGKLPGSSLYKDINRFKRAGSIEHIKIVRFPESPMYANKNILESLPLYILSQTPTIINEDATDSLDSEESSLQAHDARHTKSSITFAVIDCSMWTYIDAMGLSTLDQVLEDLNQKKVQVFLCSLHDEVYEKLLTYGLLGKESAKAEAYPDIANAVQAAQYKLEAILKPSNA